MILSIEKVLQPGVQEFITANMDADLQSLLLKKSPFQDVTMSDIVLQIRGRKIAAKKFPFLLREGVIFPPHLNLEQSSSAVAARYKAALVQGKTFLDLTSGFGVDAWYISQNFKEVTLVERDASLLQAVKNNWEVLGRKADFVNQDLETFLEENSRKFDLVFLDPARRDTQKNRVFLLQDLSPNLLEIQEKLYATAGRILVKLSPLIDISYLVSTLKNIAEIHILAVKNDVKEVLLMIDPAATAGRIPVSCVNLDSADKPLQFYFDEAASAVPSFSAVQQYLYLPNNAVMKSGAFNLVSERFGLKKLHKNTHLYTSDQLVQDFPGRTLQVEKVVAKDLVKNTQYNIVSRNHPLTPEQIKKKYRLRDGGANYLVFTEDISGMVILKSK